jgi:hypothetical protein
LEGSDKRQPDLIIIPEDLPKAGWPDGPVKTN